jgi:hypothetical protein
MLFLNKGSNYFINMYTCILSPVLTPISILLVPLIWVNPYIGAKGGTGEGERRGRGKKGKGKEGEGWQIHICKETII